jgi:hypothetical protein
MSASATALKSGPGWPYTVTPRTFLKSLHSRLSYTEYKIVAIIVDDTFGAPGRPQWTKRTLGYYARLTLTSECGVAKALHHMASEDLGVIRMRKCGRGYEYQAAVENFERAPQRGPRKIQRKPVAVASEPRRIQGENQSVVSEIDCEMTQSVTETIPILEYGYSERASEGGPMGSKEPPSSMNNERLESSELETALTLSITPKLKTLPPKKVLDETQKVLGGCPVDWLRGRIEQRFEVIRSWKMVPLLAEDAAKAWKALSELRRVPMVTRIDLSPHWASAREIRRLHRDSETPELVKREILEMWPELGRKGRDRIEEANEALRAADRRFQDRWANRKERKEN